MAQWHNVKAGRYGSRIYVWVDGALSTEAMLAHAYPHTAANTSIVLGESKIYCRRESFLGHSVTFIVVKLQRLSNAC